MRLPLALSLCLALSTVPCLADTIPGPSPRLERPAPTKQPAEPVPAAFAGIDLPRYQPPDAYSEDLVIHSQGKTFTLTRSVDGPRTRTEMKAEGMEMVTLEMGDEKGTRYTLMPKEKRATKMTQSAMDEVMKGEKSPAAAKDQTAPTAELQKVEDLGNETLQGVAAKKLRFVTSGGDVIGWFDKTTGAPLRMESKAEGQSATMEWKNRKAEKPSADLFEVPKNYAINDMDEMFSKMKGMGGMGGMGRSLGGSLGSSLGGALGGPLGTVVGQYLGSKIGGALGKKAADAIH